MIAIVISEKGGAERKQRFEKPEVTIGRVKGNDVLLAKGNVSKRHARLIQRDGRFIVTDLKSTNGTYVNHRRITHAVVREGDRIYIGDFVLWLETDADVGLGDVAAAAREPTPEPGQDDHEADGSDPPSVPDYRSGPPAPHLEAKPSSGSDGVVAHFPIEHDPDESAAGYEVPSPPRVTPATFRAPPTGPFPAPLEITGVSDVTGGIQLPPGVTPATSLAMSEALTATTGPGTDARAERARVEATQRALTLLVTTTERALERTDGFDLAAYPLSPEQHGLVQAEVARHLAELQRSGTIPAELDEEALRSAAARELLELGPLGALLADEAVTQIQVMLGRTVVTRRGRRMAHSGPDFTTDLAVGRALHRLCAGGGAAIAAGELFVNRQLGDGRQVSAIRPPASPNGHLLVVNKIQRSGMTLNALVRSGTISRSMATLLEHAVAGKANLMLVGPVGSGTRRVVDALVAAVGETDRIVWLCDSGTAAFVPDNAAAVHLGADRAAEQVAIAAVSRLEPEHLVVPRLSGDGLAGLLDAIAQGCEGTILHARASTLRQAFDRLGADLAAARPGVTLDTAREWLASAFDLGIEVARLRDGRQRVARISEIRATGKGPALRDVFTFAYHRTAEGGSIEGSFYATGVVPHVVEDLAARGMPLDTSVFRRHPTS